MPHELALLGLTGLAPQPRDMPAHRVQRRLPVCALRQRELALASHLTQQLSGAAQAVVGGEEVVPVRRLPAYMGQQAVPRKNLDRSAMPGLLQGDHGIDHGQARADDQHGRLWVEPGHRGYIPRVQRGGIQSCGLGLRSARSREHAGGQYRTGAAQLLASIEGQQHRGGIDLQVYPFGADVLDARCRKRLGLRQTLLRVQAEKPPWREQLADRHMLLVRLGPSAGADVVGEPLGQVVGIVRVNAHTRRIAVQRMAQFDRAVGFAAPQLSTGFDYQDTPRARQAKQLHGQHRAAQATTDDQYICNAGGFTHASSPLLLLKSPHFEQTVPPHSHHCDKHGAGGWRT